MPIEEAVEIAKKVAEALSAAHERRIVHRDLKPANVMVTAGGHIKLMDLGLAKRILEPGDAVSIELDTNRLTGQFNLVGTLPYMSPEQSRGEEVDARSDIFSLGLVLYEMVTGQRPFRGRAPATIFDQILNHAPEPAANLNDEVPALLERILDRALEKDRGNRYQTAADFLEDLRGLRTGSAAPNSEELEDSSPRKFPLSRRGLGIATAAFLLLVTLTSVWRFGLRSQSTASSIPGDPSSVETSDTVSSVAEIDRRFIAVLPFVDLNADQGNLAFTSGLHSDILHPSLPCQSAQGDLPHLGYGVCRDNEKSAPDCRGTGRWYHSGGRHPAGRQPRSCQPPANRRPNRSTPLGGYL